MNEIDIIKNKIVHMLISLGFKEVTFGGTKNYVLGSTYCIPNYLDWLGFFIEYADSKEEALNNGYEDGNGFPLDMGTKAILIGLKSEVTRNTPKLQQESRHLEAV
jgi:hypothetical protein